MSVSCFVLSYRRKAIRRKEVCTVDTAGAGAFIRLTRRKEVKAIVGGPAITYRSSNVV